MWREMLRRNVVDDEQTTVTLTYFSDPESFNVVYTGIEGWYTILKPWT
jgi:hypothetical protein